MPMTRSTPRYTNWRQKERMKLMTQNIHATPEQSDESFDPFDPANLRVGSTADIEVERVLTAVPVRRPKRNEFVRVHPDYVLDTLVLEHESGMDKETYLVAPDIHELVLPELRRTRLHVA